MMNYSWKRVEHVVSLPNKEIHSDIQTAHYQAQFLLIASQVRPVGIDQAEKCTNLTKHLPGFCFIKKPHDDPRILALYEITTNHCLVTSAARIRLHNSAA